MIDRYAISMGVSPREPLTRVGELAAQAERLGFDAMWFIDHQLGMKDVYAAMNVAALRTTKIEIGSAVTNLLTRHPTVTANATAALDELSNGRALLGLGAGWVALRSIGLTPVKVAGVEAGIDGFRKLFSGERVEVDGQSVQLATARRQIPIYLAVSQPRMLRMSGEKCDGAILMGAAHPEFCTWQLEHIYAGLERAGRERKDIVVDLTVTMSIDDDQDKAMSDVRAWATSQAATFKVWKSMPPAWEKYRPEFAAAVDSYHYKEHLSLRAQHKQVVSDEFVQSVAIGGNLEYCVGRLRELMSLDIDRITFALLSGGRDRRLAQLAGEVIPRLGAAPGSRPDRSAR